VRAVPDGIETSALTGALADGWNFVVEGVEYAAVGGGSYHWVVTGLDGTRRFVTVDDLDQKAWLGDTRDSACDGLRRAFDTAVVLRNAGLGFVVAPIPTSRGETLRRIGPRHAIALFPFVGGQAGRYGHYDAAALAAVVSMLAELHQATPAVGSVPRSVGLGLPGRRHLEAGLRDLNHGWSGGPFSEPARHAFALHASDVAELLSLADRLAADVKKRDSGWVVTHGEPHAANMMQAGNSHLLVDWDTAALAPPERDLWMLVDDPATDLTVYIDATGHQIDQAAVDFFSLIWDLKDLAEYLNVLRSPHRESEDTVRAYEGLTNCVTSRDRWGGVARITRCVEPVETSRTVSVQTSRAI
jgi:spectinomycin phosphotransferase